MIHLNTVSLLQQYDGSSGEKSPIMGLFLLSSKENEEGQLSRQLALW